ncbi:MAG: hypothetical protein ABF714_13315, partial [Novacetimonas hansenii]|uniref:hypothetical protein n=1 Tax=Novacetimonas hansenii TaxID=436 RepID=UPI0039E7E6FF
LVKLFLKSFERRCLFEKRRHPKTFLLFINDLFSNRDGYSAKNIVSPRSFLLDDLTISIWFW